MKAKNLFKILFIVFSIALIVFLLISIIGDYATQNWNWVGVSDFTTPANEYQRGKTLWDWLNLLIIPFVLALGAWWLNRQERISEREIAKERVEEGRRIAKKQVEEDRRIAKKQEDGRVLQSYFEAITTLLLEKDLRTSEEVQTIARARTLTILNGLSGEGKGSVIRFLSEAKLIDKMNIIVSLVGADLSQANLKGANLRGVNLASTNMEAANLVGTDLPEANLYGVNLKGANLNVVLLSGALLERADLSGANLEGAILEDVIMYEADLSRADLSKARLIRADLYGTNLTGANLSGAILSGAKMYRANLRETNLSGVLLEEADLKEAIYNEATVWPNNYYIGGTGAKLVK